MSLARVAEIAGVSVATVSRVLNNSPKVSDETAEAVRRVMTETQFKRQRMRRQTATRTERSVTIATLIFGPSRRAHPAFLEDLLRGVSAATAGQDVEMMISFVASPDDLPRRVRQGKVDGLLLHGAHPDEQIQAAIKDIPAVWLMSNRQRPMWGDQVMPDNTGVGEIAADYLIDQGHKRIAFVNLVWRSWFWEMRARAFLYRARQRGAEATVVPAEAINLPPEDRTKPWPVTEVVNSLVELDPRPTGLFIGEDFQVPTIAADLRHHGLAIGPNKDFEIIACNNEQMHFSTLDHTPTTIDIQAEVIGRRGVQLLLSRIDGDDSDRLRELIEPVLVQSKA